MLEWKYEIVNFRRNTELYTLQVQCRMRMQSFLFKLRDGNNRTENQAQVISDHGAYYDFIGHTLMQLVLTGWAY